MLSDPDPKKKKGRNKKKKEIKQSFDSIYHQSDHRSFFFFLFFFPVVYKFVSICNGTRGDSCAYTRWKMDDAPRILFVPPVTIIREWQAETRRYPSNRLRSQPFSSNAPFALRATTLPKLNQEIPFAFRLAYGVSHRGKWKQEEDRTTAEPGKKFRSSSKKSPLLSGLLYLFNSVWDVSAICAATMTREKERRICSFHFFFFLEKYG